MSPKKGAGTAVKTGAICVVAYLVGVALSPRILPVDFVSSRLQRRADLVAKPQRDHNGSKADVAPSLLAAEPAAKPSAPTPSSPPAKLPGKSEPRRREYASPHEASYRSIVNRDAGDGFDDPFRGVEILVHRNGDPGPCSRQAGGDDDGDDDDADRPSPASLALLRAVDARHEGPAKPLDEYTKYDFDAVLTHALAVGSATGSGRGPLLGGRGDSCGPTWKEELPHYMDRAPHLKGKPEISDMIKFCDMGLDRTPIQLDHGKLVVVPEVLSRPCNFHTREGLRVTGLGQLAGLARGAKARAGECAENQRNNDGTCGAGGGGAARELHLYAVPAGRVFVFAPSHVGEVFELPHVAVPLGLPVYLEVISLKPRVFDIFNFFSRDESAAIVAKALGETSESHRMKRSSTGASGYNVNSQRTSDNGFDTHGKQAQAVKRRCMNILGFDTYEESLTDGLQVLRYNKTTAYVPHLDWIDDHHKQQEHDFDSAHLGSNRIATILLYMSDLGENDGGETVFAEGWPPNQAEGDRVQLNDALADLRESGDVRDLLERGSWQESMVAKCRSRLSVRPHSSRAVLFYSQNPDGTPDADSLHGGCPVIGGEKWAANLWVWNAPRSGFPGSPKNAEVVARNRASGKSPDQDEQKKASFSNSGEDERARHAQLFFQDTFWGKLGFGDPALNANTYEGHQWNVKVDGVTLKQFVIDKKKQQRYTI